jgi:hypothetical protein
LAACLYIACRQEDKPRTFKGLKMSHLSSFFSFVPVWLELDFHT